MEKETTDNINEEIQNNTESKESLEQLEGQKSFFEEKNLFIQEVSNDIAIFKNDNSKLQDIETEISIDKPNVIEHIRMELNLDESISELNLQADQLEKEILDNIISESTETSIESQESFKLGIIDIGSIYDQYSTLAEIGTKEEYIAHVEKYFPEKKAHQLDGNFVQESLDTYLKEMGDSSETKHEKELLNNFITLSTKEDFSKFEPYQRSEHLTINGLLRKGKDITIENVIEQKNKPINPLNIVWNTDIVETYDALVRCIDNSYLYIDNSTPINTLNRHIHDKQFYNLNNVGDIITEKGFLSTSTDEEYRDFYVNSDKEATILTMKFPEHSIVNGLYFGNVEKEFLMPPGTAYKITNKEEIEINGTGKTLLEVEFLPGEHIHVLGSQKDIADFRESVTKEANAKHN